MAVLDGGRWQPGRRKPAPLPGNALVEARELFLAAVVLPGVLTTFLWVVWLAAYCAQLAN